MDLKPAQFAAVVFILALASPRAFAQDTASPAEHPRVSYGTETDFESAFIWRGIAYDNRPVWVPSAWISVSGLSLTAWSIVPMTHAPETTHLRTTTLELAYEKDWNKVRITPALETYLNHPPPGVSDPNTMEGTLALSYPVGPVRVFTMHAFDVWRYKGAYFGQAGARYEKQISRKASVDFAVRSGWASQRFNAVYIGLAKPAFNFAGAEGSLTYYLKPHWYVHPHAEFDNVLDPQLRSQLDWPTVVSFGLAMGLDF